MNKDTNTKINQEMNHEVHHRTLDQQVLNLLKSHRSIRKFTDETISDQTLVDMLQAAQMASTSSHVQAYSIVGVTDQEKREQLAACAGDQQYVASCACFFVFCADLHRLDQVTQEQGVDATETLETTEKFMVATIDAALAAQNMAVAAESKGLGIVYIGGLRNQPQRVSDLLRLPQKVYPVFGMCVGYPDQDPEVKPRLPQQVIYHENEYTPYTQVKEDIKAYDQEVQDYYIRRTKGKREDMWTENMGRLLQKPTRTHMKAFLQDRGFPLN